MAATPVGTRVVWESGSLVVLGPLDLTQSPVLSITGPLGSIVSIVWVVTVSYRLVPFLTLIFTLFLYLSSTVLSFLLSSSTSLYPLICFIRASPVAARSRQHCLQK